MKFIVFNIVVAVALVYLVANKDNGFDVSLPNLDSKLGDVTAAAEQAFDRAAPLGQQALASIDAPTIADADLIDSAPEPELKVAAAAPAPVFEPPLPAPHVIEVATRQTHVIKAPKPRDRAPSSEVARRRAEVLGEGPVTAPGPVRSAADRRRQLLDLAEEMEYLAAEFSVQ